MKDISELCDDFYERASEIPFGNSDFQCQNLVVAQHTEPTRAYRQVLLEMGNLIDALQESHFNHKLQLIDDAELAEQMKDADKFEKQRIELKLEKNKLSLRKSEKLIKDALHSLGLYNEQLKLFPKYTREQFESQEQNHFETLNANNVMGALNPAHNLNLSASRMKSGMDAITSKIDSKQLEANNG